MHHKYQEIQRYKLQTQTHNTIVQLPPQVIDLIFNLFLFPRFCLHSLWFEVSLFCPVFSFQLRCPSSVFSSCGSFAFWFLCLVLSPLCLQRDSCFGSPAEDQLHFMHGHTRMRALQPCTRASSRHDMSDILEYVRYNCAREQAHIMTCCAETVLPHEKTAHTTYS